MTTVTTESQLSQRLKDATRGIHEALDRRIMAANPFASRERYARFLQVQYRFHYDIDPLYCSPIFRTLVADLSERRRLHRILADLYDLDIAISPREIGTCVPPLDTSLAGGMGWLYVAEGSNLGAAILSKMAAKLNLDDQFGARHLAGAPDGRAQQWRQFTQVLNGLVLDTTQQQQVIDGARNAFECVRQHAERELSV